MYYSEAINKIFKEYSALQLPFKMQLVIAMCSPKEKKLTTVIFTI